ncbi:MAG: PTS sugar transporter subunit IIB [Eubacteriales bacterium]|nr:PTS sugar transporter subunit IIB [Eubacteriales bacterium]
MKLKVLLCCGAGMSSGFLAQRTRAAAKKRKVDIILDAKSESMVSQFLEDIDILLIGPHLQNYLHNYEERCNGYNVKVAVIPKDIYGTIDGEKLLDFILQM